MKNHLIPDDILTSTSEFARIAERIDLPVVMSENIGVVKKRTWWRLPRLRAQQSLTELLDASERQILEELDRSWLQTVSQFCARRGHRYQLPWEFLNAWAPAAALLTQRYGQHSIVLTDADSSIAALLAAACGYVPLIDQQFAGALASRWSRGRLLQLAVLEAPAVIVLDTAAGEMVRRLGVTSVWDFSQLAPEQLEPTLRELASDVADASGRHSGFDSLSQKRAERLYEADSIPIYNAKYHDGAAYQNMDEKLVRVIADCVAADGIRQPRILDLGCGPGSLTDLLLTIPGIQLTGVDLVPEMIAAARQQRPHVQFEVGDAESLHFPDNSFDVILCSGVLHHLPALRLAMDQIRRVLAPNGLLVAREPNSDNFSHRHSKLAYAHLALRHVLFHNRRLQPIIEPDAHGYHRDFQYDELCYRIAEHMYVERFQTDLMVSYFYDEVFLKESDRLSMLQLDDSLIGQPGLNVVVVARNSARQGMSPEVFEQLQQLRRVRPVCIGHYRYLLEFVQENIEEPENQFFSELTPETLYDDQQRFDFLIRNGGKVLITGNSVSRKESARVALDDCISDRQSLMFLLQVTGRDELDELSKLQSDEKFDQALIYLDEPCTSEQLKNWMKAVHNYGVIHFDITHGIPFPEAGDEERDFFTQYFAITFNGAVVDGRARFAVAFHLHSPRDFYCAFLVALNSARLQTDNAERSEFDRIRSQAIDALRQTEGMASCLEQHNCGRNLISIWEDPVSAPNDPNYRVADMVSLPLDHQGSSSG